MSQRRLAQIAFILMGLFIIEIFGMLQAIFSTQIIKNHLDVQTEKTSEMILNQFVRSYYSNNDIRNELTQLSYTHYDDGLTQIYKGIRQTLSSIDHIEERYFNAPNNKYVIGITPNNGEAINTFMDRYGLDLTKVTDYKIVSYQIRQADNLLRERRILVGLSKGRQWIISVEINQNDIQEQVARAQQGMSDITATEHFYDDSTGSFYVITPHRKVIYQGGKQLNGKYFNNKDMNTGRPVIDLVTDLRSLYKKVIYQGEAKVNRSLIRSYYDEATHLYFVLEIDQSAVFSNYDKHLRMIWLLGSSILGITFAILLLVWGKYRNNTGGTL